MYVYLHQLPENFLRKTRAMRIEFKIDGAQPFSRNRMCTEFVMQILNKRMRMYFSCRDGEILRRFMA